MSWKPSAPQTIIAFVVLVFVSLAVAVLPSGGDPGPASLESTPADIEIVVSAVKTGGAEMQAVAIPVAREGASVSALPRPSAPESALSMTARAADELGPAQSMTDAMAPDSAQERAPSRRGDRARRRRDRQNRPDYDGHTYVDHVTELLGAQMLEPGQETYGGYKWVGENEIQARSPITGMRPVIEQAITDVAARRTARGGSFTGEPRERAIARQLTQLNDWEDLNPETQEKMMILSGIDIQAMDPEERESTINHLQHSPLPFGNIEEPLSPDVTIDLGFTHTLDKRWTLVVDLGEGVFEITMISNNNNGSHTGHNLGTFKVQLTTDTTLDEALAIGNGMVINENNNRQLYLADAAKRILYGETPLLDFSAMTAEEKLASYAGKGLGEAIQIIEISETSQTSETDG